MDPAFPDRVRKERYFDRDFYELEVEKLWPRIWQMACRLEEIPAPHDFVEYEILDQSIIVVRNDDMSVSAFQNVCRHRGVKLVEGRGTCASGFTCPFHGWCYGPDGKNIHFQQRKTFAEHNLAPDDINLTPARPPHTASGPIAERCGVDAGGSTWTKTRRPCVSASSPTPRSWTSGT